MKVKKGLLKEALSKGQKAAASSSKATLTEGQRAAASSSTATLSKGKKATLPKGKKATLSKSKKATLPKGKQRKLTRKNLKNLGKLSLTEKVEKIAEETDTAEEAALALKESIDQNERGKIWAKHQPWNTTQKLRHSTRWPTRLRKVSFRTTEAWTKGEQWQSEAKMLKGFGKEEFAAQPGRTQWRSDPWTPNIFNYRDLGDRERCRPKVKDIPSRTRNRCHRCGVEEWVLRWQKLRSPFLSREEEPWQKAMLACLDKWWGGRGRQRPSTKGQGMGLWLWPTWRSPWELAGELGASFSLSKSMPGCNHLTKVKVICQKMTCAKCPCQKEKHSFLGKRKSKALAKGKVHVAAATWQKWSPVQCPCEKDSYNLQ